MIVEINVCGIPAIADVVHYRPGDPGYIDGPPERERDLIEYLEEPEEYL